MHPINFKATKPLLKKCLQATLKTLTTKLPFPTSTSHHQYYNNFRLSNLSTVTKTMYSRQDFDISSIQNAKGLVFDMDGTLVLPITKYLQRMRAELKVPAGIRTLTYVETLAEPEKEEAYKLIRGIEQEARLSMELQPGFVRLFKYLETTQIPKSIITLNNSETVEHMLNTVIPEQMNGLSVNFDHILTREFGFMKPDPTPLHHVAEQLNVKTSELVMVGDSTDDIECGRNAGSITILLKNDVNDHAVDDAHVVISRLDHIVDILDSPKQNIL